MRTVLLLLGCVALSLAADLPGMWRKVEEAGEWPSPRYGQSWEIKDDNTGILFGGWGPDVTGNMAYLNDLWLFDAVHENWTQVKPMPGSVVPPPRQYHTCNLIDHQKMYCYGGRNTNGVLGDMWYFDFDAMRWFPLDAPAAGPRYGHTANADCASNMLIIFGGAREDGVTNDMWTYTFANKEWVQFHTDITPPPRMFHSMVTTLCEGIPDPFDIHLTLHGGQLSTQAGAMDVWQFHMSSAVRAQWNEELYRPDNLPLRFGHFAFDIGNLMMIWGGASSDINTAWFNEIFNTWYTHEPYASNHPPPLRFMGAELTMDKIYIFGGYDMIHQSVVNDLWVYTLDTCMYQTDCDTCIARQPTCGWCASKHACLSGDVEPFYESCPVWRTKSCLPDCHKAKTCDECTVDASCGWCFRIPTYPAETEGCLAGTTDGPIFGDCFDWTKRQEGCPECQRTSDCGDCLNSKFCGYCPSLKMCMDGNDKGPTNGTCPDWVRAKESCSAPSVCSQYGNCDSCTADAGCGYCADDVAVKCMSGTAKGPKAGTCQNWNYGTCSPAGQCDSYRSCDKCVADSKCGFCGDLGVSRCVAGTQSGPASGICHNWAFSQCVAPTPTPAPAGLGGGWIAFVVILCVGVAAGGFLFYWFYWRSRRGRAVGYSTLSGAGAVSYGAR